MIATGSWPNGVLTPEVIVSLLHIQLAKKLPSHQKPSDLVSHIQPVPGKPLHFTAAGLIRPDLFDPVQLEPFFGIHDARYMMYWRIVSPDAYSQVVEDVYKDSTHLWKRYEDHLKPFIPRMRYWMDQFGYI